jgi:putative membrane-bound dehydrogenase-like protein
MRIIRHIFLGLFLLFGLAPSAPADEVTQVGAARIDITPDEPIRLAGYGNRTTEASEVAQPLWAKAIAIGGDDLPGPAVMIAVENCGMTTQIRDRVASQLSKQVGLPSDHLVISVTHTHAGPMLTDWAPFIFGSDLTPDQQQRIDRYTQRLADLLIDVSKQALADRQPARLFWGVGEAGFAVNRRRVQDGSWTGFGEQANGPVDHRLPLLVARNMDDEVFAVVANYACHCTTLGGSFNKIAGDWAGFAAESIEEDFSGAIALITIGAGADANPTPRGNDLDICRQQGRQLADEVKRLIGTGLASVSTQLECHYRSIQLPFDELPSRDEWKQRAAGTGAQGYHASQFLASLERGEELPHQIPYTVATWTFGDDLAMVFLAGEVVVDYALRLYEEMDGERLWITAYSNDVPCYIPSQRILREGGYEADRSMIYYARPAPLAGETEQRIMDTIQKLLPPRYYSVAKQELSPPPKSPEDAIRSMRLPSDVRIDIAAAEPLIVDPVAFDWGPDGRLWVVEMRDYPNGLGWNGKGDPLNTPGGRVKVLVDDDQDGRFDRATVFLDDLSYPTGIKVWRQGVMVTSAPDIFYAEDTDGDDRADRRETLYRGFGEGNQQHRVNGLRWGLNHWLYLANGDSGGKIRSLRTGQELEVAGRDIRISPDDGGLETESGQTQFGRCRDDAGNWFGGNNSHPIWHYVLDDNHLRRNPHVKAASTRREIAEQPGAAPVYPASKTLSRFNDFDKVDRFTSACSPLIFRDLELLQKDPRQYAFVCEPVHNLVHRSIVRADDVSFVSQRGGDESQAEFLASDDNWFRPSMVRTGPDGALWVADMYRLVIEHPTWIPTAWQQKLNLRAGDDRGRIYRIRFPGMPTRPLPKLDTKTTSELVATLDDPNGTRRDMVHQMLVWRDDPAAVEPLRQLMADARWPATRWHALYLLDAFDALDSSLLEQAIDEFGPITRRHAIRLAESRLNDEPNLGDALLRWLNVEDPTPEDRLVTLQLAATLAAWDDDRAAKALAAIAVDNVDNPYLVATAMSSLNGENLPVVLPQVLTLSHEQPAEQLLQPLLRTAIALKDVPSLKKGLKVVMRRGQDDYATWQLDILSQLLPVVQQHERQSGSLGEEWQQSLQDVMLRCRTLARQGGEADLEMRIAATRLLGQFNRDRDPNRRILAKLLDPQNPLPIQEAAITAIASQPDDQTPPLLLGSWDSLSPNIRGQILDKLIERSPWCLALLERVETGQLSASLLDARRRQQLLRHRDKSVAQRAASLLEATTNSNRQQLVDQYRAAAPSTGNPQSGQQLFTKHCSKCHRFQGAGHSVGPDLAAVTDRSLPAMILAVMDPNRAVEDKFLDFVAVTTDGRQHTGMIVREDSNSITLSAGEGKEQTLLRGEIELFRSAGKSMMPEGLERELSPEHISDLVAYVNSVRPAPKTFPGNTPQVAPVRNDGSIRLFAIHSRIHGPTLMFEDEHRNLGWWQSTEDFASWDVNVPRAGRYRVRIDYSCPEDSAGNRFQINAAGQSIGQAVNGTGGWNQYRSATVGTLDLPDGPAEIVIRSDGPISGALMDLRTVLLHPVDE